MSCFVTGLLYGLHELHTEERGVLPTILRGIRYQVTNNNTVELTLVCPGSKVLYYYFVGADKPIEDLSGTTSFEMHPPITISTIAVPAVGAETATGLIGVLGGGTLFKSFTGSSTSFKQKEWLAIGLGMLSGFWAGYYVAYEVIPPGCESTEKFIEKIRELDWHNVADRFFLHLLDWVAAACHKPKDDEAQWPHLDWVYDIRLNRNHASTANYIWLHEQYTSCDARNRFIVHDKIMANPD